MRQLRTDLAKRLRRTQTDVEKLLWRYLRDRALKNYKFRRQQPIGNYVVDLLCPEARLIVELDGGQPAVDDQRDKLRTTFLEQEGYRVIRFWNNDILTYLDGVIATISDKLQMTQK